MTTVMVWVKRCDESGCEAELNGEADIQRAAHVLGWLSVWSTTERCRDYCPVHAKVRRLEAAVAEALDSFWASIVKAYPECKAGDLDMESALRLFGEAKRATEQWLEVNSE